MRLGFACKYMHNEDLPAKELEVIESHFNCKTTTFTWADRQARNIAENKLHSIVSHNISALNSMVDYVGSLDKELRMFRISSDICPLYTHPNWISFWKSSELQSQLESDFSLIGEKIRKNDIKISFHPAQFTILASDKEDVVVRSIEEFEYHADMARWLGYGKSFQDGCKINIHIGGKGGTDALISNLGRLSDVARNLITIENDEFSYGIDEIIKLKDHVALVLDVHHHWINSGEYISADSDQVKNIVDSWRGIRPSMHYSVSKRSVLSEHSIDEKPDLVSLLNAGYKKTALRAHSDDYWNNACNDWISSFTRDFDIMCESKHKNLASIKLLAHIKGLVQIC
jgi:UV DNA damage endonuclease